MKIRIERLEIDAPDLIKDFFEAELRRDQADGEHRARLMQMATAMMKKGLEQLGVHIYPCDPPDSDDPVVTPPPYAEEVAP